MAPRIVAFVDHEIGYRLLQRLLTMAAEKRIILQGVVTTLENGTTWWPGIEELCLQAGVPLWRYAEPFEGLPPNVSADWYLLLSWKHVLSGSTIATAECGVVNLHYSLLPEYRGVYPVNWAIIEGAAQTGISYHHVTSRIDDGEIIVQARTAIMPQDTARTLQLRLDDLAFDAFDALIDTLDYQPGRVPPKARTSTGSYKSRAAFKAACQIDLEKSYTGNELINLLRGLTFFPESGNAYFIDPQTGTKVMLSLNLAPLKT